jgi:uncharacterized protein with GYD domain
MPTYVTLMKWTEQGRQNIESLPDRAEQVSKRVEQAGGKLIGNFVTMGRYDQISVVEAPDDETAARLLLVIAGRGNAVTETLRGFTMEEVRELL